MQLLSPKGKYKEPPNGVNQSDEYCYTSSGETDDDRFQDDEQYVSIFVMEWKLTKYPFLTNEWITNISNFEKDIPMQSETGAKVFFLN